MEQRKRKWRIKDSSERDSRFVAGQREQIRYRRSRQVGSLHEVGAMAGPAKLATAQTCHTQQSQWKRKLETSKQRAKGVTELFLAGTFTGRS